MSLARTSLAVAAVLLVGCGSAHRSPPSAPVQQAPAAPAAKKAARIVIPAGSGSLAAMSGPRGLILRDRPNGRVIAHLMPRTVYGSPTVVWAAAQRGRWLGVVAASVGNNRLGWLDVDRDKPRMWRSRYTLVAQLSTRTLILERGTRTVRTMRISIGTPDTPTPLGRFEVTDKLLPRGGGYGCCILALSGHQPHLRPGWAGGDRIAIHGTPTNIVGEAASAGCLRARNNDLRYLMKRVPLGTPVRIKA